MKLVKRKKGGITLDKDQIREIKAGRKKLRKDLRKMGIKDIKEFEVTASSMGLYFDSNTKLAGLFWAMQGKVLLSLLGASTLLLGAVFAASLISEMQGHFTINLSESLQQSGFSLSETEDFAESTSRLYYDGESTFTCISIADIEAYLDLDTEGLAENTNYFMYTFYLRNEGEEIVDYEYQLIINSESQDLSSACWIMIFSNDEMIFYAEPDEDGNPETIPDQDDDSRGYLVAPMYEYALYPEEQYELITGTTNEYYRIISVPFVDEGTIAEGIVEEAETLDAHKYTVLMWLEGDDPDCIDDIIGGHMGVEMQFNLASDEDDEGENTQIQDDEGMFNSLGEWWSEFTSSFR